jgi:hypothetical protein
VYRCLREICVPMFKGNLCTDVAGKFVSLSVLIIGAADTFKTSLHFYQCSRAQSPEESNIVNCHREERKKYKFLYHNNVTNLIHFHFHNHFIVS